MFLLVGMLVGVGIGLLVYWGVPGLSDRTRHVPPSVGMMAEDFQLTRLDGTKLKLSDLRGQPVLINFWATWCQPCREEMPLFERTSQSLGDRLVIVGVNDAEGRRQVEQYVQEMDIHFSIVLDQNGLVSEHYFVRSYPSSFFIDAQGIIRAMHLGTLTEDQLNLYLGTVGITR